MRKLLEAVDSMEKAAKKSTGPKFPGYWKGTDPASKAKSKMVGGCEESIIKDLHNTAKEKVTEWSLLEKFNKFKEETNNTANDWAALRASSGPDLPKAELDKQWNASKTPTYTGIDPIVRQRMGMQPATQDEIRTYLDKNPPVVQTSTGEPVRSGSGAPVGSGGQINVAKAADLVSPDRDQSIAREPGTTVAQQPVAQPAPSTVVPGPEVKPVAEPVKITSQPLPPATTATAPAPTKPAAPVIPQMPKNPAPGSWQEVWKSNPAIKNPNKIYPGQEIKLPGSTEKHIVSPGDTLEKIAAKVRRGEIGGSSVDPNAQTPATSTRTNTSAAPTTRSTTPTPSVSTADSLSPGERVVNKTAASSAPTPTATQPATKTAAPAPASTQTVPSQASAAASTPADQQTPTKITGHLPGTKLFRDVKDPSDPTKNINVSFTKQSDGTYKSDDGRWHVKNPKNIEALDTSPSHFGFADAKQADRYTKLDSTFRSNLERASKDSGIPITVTSSARTAAEQEKLHRDYKAGRPGVYGAPPKDPESHKAHAIDARADQIAALRNWLAKNDPKGDKYNLGFLPNDPVHVQHTGYRSGMKENKDDNLIASRYDPDDFDNMIARVKKLVQKQEREHGPVDIAKLAQKLRALDRKKTNEVEDPAVNKQDPDIQITSQTSVQQDPAAVKQQQLDQMQDVSTAKSTMSGLSSVLGPKVDTNTLSSAVTKISDNKPLTSPESMSMSALTPLIAKAAESPQSAPALKTALSNAAMLARQGK